MLPNLVPPPLKKTSELDKLKNRRNGHSKKTIKGEFGEVARAVPRDRNGDFEPLVLKKGQTRFDNDSNKVLLPDGLRVIKK